MINIDLWLFTFDSYSNCVTKYSRRVDQSHLRRHVYIAAKGR